MRVDLFDDPAVISIARETGLGEDAVVGKLHRIWSWADRHTVDGYTTGVSEKWVDRYISCQGFSVAMKAAGWLEFDDNSITFPEFQKHNGINAKKRADASIRQRLSRQNRDEGVTGVTRDLIPRPFAKLVMARDGYTCVYCGCESSKSREESRKALLSIDHLIPASRGGKSAIPNLVCCCKLCNNEKNDRTPEEWGIDPKFLQPGVTYVSQQICDTSVTREEKRRVYKKPPTPFIRPTVEEVSAYCRERGNAIDPEEFVSHYEANGWIRGKTPIKDWQACVRTWEAKERKESKSHKPRLLTPEEEAAWTPYGDVQP